MEKTDFNIDKDLLKITTARIFNAQPARLWLAYTDPKQIPRWWGPSGLQTTIIKNDVRVGGSWRYIQIEPNGTEHGFRGEYTTVNEPHVLIRTFEYEPMPGHILTETLTLTESSDTTTQVCVCSQFANLEDLEGMVRMGVESGQRESFDRLVLLVGSERA